MSIQNIAPNASLSTLAAEIAVDPAYGFVAERLFPRVAMNVSAGPAYYFDSCRPSSVLTDTAREYGSKATEIDFSTTPITFSCMGHSVSHLVKREYLNYDSVGPYTQAVDFCVSGILNKREKELKVLLDASLSSYDATHAWNTSTGDPVGDINSAITDIRDACGVAPNSIVMDREVWLAVKNHEDIIERVKYTGVDVNPGNITTSGFANLFDLPNIIIADTHYPTGAATTKVWGSDVYVFYANPRPSIVAPSLGYSFVWNQMGSGGWAAYDYPAIDRGGDFVQLDYYYDQQLVCANAGYKLTSTLVGI